MTSEFPVIDDKGRLDPERGRYGGKRGWRIFRPRLFIGMLIVCCSILFAGFTAYLATSANSDKIDFNTKAVQQLARLQKQIDAESAQRRSDTCRAFEQQHRQEVTQLKRTYAYLLSLPKAERRLTINKTVAAGVPQAEKNARSDQDDFGIFVPTYCDSPHVGLPEPDPVIPRRPKGLRPPAVPTALP